MSANSSVRDLMNASVGTTGSKYITDSSVTTPVDGSIFFCIIPQEDITIEAMSVESNHADYTGLVLLAGIPVYTECTSLKLTSGKCTVYEKISE